MKKSLLFMLLYVLFFSFFFQDGTSKNCNKDMTVFWLDSVCLYNYRIVQSGINGHRFIIPDSIYSVGKKKVKYWNRKDAVIYSEEVFGILGRCCIPGAYAYNDSIWNEIWPWNELPDCYFVPKVYSEDSECELLRASKPTFFRVFRIRGDVYNKITSGLDVWWKPIKFRHPKKFYTVYCPVR